MNYISAIQMPEHGCVDSWTFPMGHPGRGVQVTVTNIETSKSSVLDSVGLLNMDCLGYARNSMDGISAIVRYDEKSARLFRYIDEAATVSGTDAVDFTSADFCNMKRGGNEVVKATGNANLAVNTDMNTYSVCGKFGSVGVELLGSGYFNVYTLYDILGILCRQSGVNLLSYERIQLYSKFASYTTTFRLSQSHEAKRFFAKMAIDVAKSRESA